MDDLMRWRTDTIAETLFLSDINDSFKKVKNDLDTLRGIRNKLLHGEIDNPTSGDVKTCIDTALTLTPILQTQDSTSVHPLPLIP
jgi:hypothetical protein